MQMWPNPEQEVSRVSLHQEKPSGYDGIMATSSSVSSQIEYWGQPDTSVLYQGNSRVVNYHFVRGKSHNSQNHPTGVDVLPMIVWVLNQTCHISMRNSDTSRIVPQRSSDTGESYTSIGCLTNWWLKDLSKHIHCWVHIARSLGHLGCPSIYAWMNATSWKPRH